MYLKVKVLTSQNKESFKEIKEGVFEAKVKEKSEQNLANKKVLSLTAKHFGVNVRQVSIKNGHHRHSKLLEVKNV